MSLEELKAANTKVSLHLETKHFSTDRLPFPQLRRLDLSGCPLGINASDLFDAFSFNRHVQELLVVNASLNGQMPDLQQRSNFELDGIAWTTKEVALGNSLVRVDISHNNLTQVLVGKNVGTLLSLGLRGNRLLLGVSDVLLQADGVVLDLRETAVHQEDLFSGIKAVWHRGNAWGFV